MRPHRRRNYLINKKLQLRYATYIFCILLTVSLASTACLSFGLWEKVQKEFSVSSMHNRLQTASRISDYHAARMAPEDIPRGKRLADYEDVALLSAREQEIMETSIKQNIIDLAIKATILFVIIGLGTVLLTHKIAGPLFRFQKTFQDLNNGNVKQRVYLRKGDHAQDLLPHLNAMLGSLDYSFSKMKVLTSLIFQELDTQNVSSENLTYYKTEIERELGRYTTSDAFKV